VSVRKRSESREEKVKRPQMWVSTLEDRKPFTRHPVEARRERMMNARRIMMILTTLALVVAIVLGVSSLQTVTASNAALPQSNKVALDNVRAYAPAADGADGVNYAIDGGLLYAGKPLDWKRVALPDGVIANAVTSDANNSNTVYVGASNELAVYRSTDGGLTWLRVPLSDEMVAGVTALAFDAHNRILFAGTDTAGIFRLRDVGSSLILGGHTMIDEPVLQVASDSTGAAFAFFRTPTSIYRAENGGMAWTKVNSTFSSPTALAVSNAKPPVAYVGTADLGVTESTDGVAWMLSNDGLNFGPGVRLHVDALAVDPVQPEVLYIATSYLMGSTTLHQTSNGVAMTVDGANEWAPVVRSTDALVTDLLPVSGKTGAVYTLSNMSRAPLALGVAQVAPTLAPAESINNTPADFAGLAATWLVALAAAAWLAVLGYAEVRSRSVSTPMHQPAIAR
jgi:hypothetical protein